MKCCLLFASNKDETVNESALQVSLPCSLLLLIPRFLLHTLQICGQKLSSAPTEPGEPHPDTKRPPTELRQEISLSQHSCNPLDQRVQEARQYREVHVVISEDKSLLLLQAQLYSILRKGVRAHCCPLSDLRSWSIP